MRRVVIVQHGDKERRSGDPGLTRLGHEQARATARWLAHDADRPVAIWSSPLRRAVETAAPIAEALGLEVTLEPRLRERMNWAGEADQSLEAFLDEWRQASADRAFQPRSGDSSIVAAQRFLAALDDLRADHQDGTVLVVAHGGVTTDAVRTLLGDEELRARAPTLIDQGVPCCARTTLRSGPDGWAVESIAVTDHLGEATPHRA